MRRQHNSWFRKDDLVTTVLEINKSTPVNWMKLGARSKYIQIKIDSRSGDFVLKDSYGQIMTDQEINELFPGMVTE
jgi:hypothetical protein